MLGSIQTAGINASIKNFVSAEEIRELNEKKQYTLLATQLIRKIVTDANLTGSAAKLWQYLYTKACLNSDLKVRISYHELANAFCCSRRTVMRHAADLVKNGYLIIEKNYYQHGQRANTFYISFRKNFITEVQKSENRKSKTADIEKTIIPKIDMCSTMNVASQQVEDRIVTPGSDIKVTQNITKIKENILSNNNTVVDCDFEKELENYKNKIHQAEKDCGKAEHDWLSEENIAKKYDKLRLFTALDGRLTVLQNKLADLEKLKFKKIRDKEWSSNLIRDVHFMNNKPGERQFSKIQIERLISKLANTEAQQPEKNKLINEIVFAIRFGSLKICKENKRPTTINHAINIALKLVNEKRWETPIDLFQLEYGAQ